MNYQETLDDLYSLQKFGIKFGLSQTKNLLEKLGRPQAGLRCLHLAGTNGKGSVGAMVVSVLTQAGYKVGYYTSPHLVSFRERFLIGREMISREKVVELAERVKQIMVPDEPPTFFEFVTAMAFVYFAESEVDLAVMETGMGGRLDATNLVEPFVGVITNISVEHTDFLGRTLVEIAGEKAGIIKPGQSLAVGERRPRLVELFRETARQRGADIFCLGRDFKVRRRSKGGFDYFGLHRKMKELETNLAGPYQVPNAALALAALELLEGRGFQIAETDIRTGLKSVFWPGRAEIFPGPPDIMLDGAHNPGAARALARLLPRLNYDRLHLVLGIMADKNIPKIMEPLLPHAQTLFLTRPDYSRAAAPEVLARSVRDFTGPVTILPGIPQTIEAARAAAGHRDLILITGSFFTVGEARGYLTGDKDD